MIQEKLLDFEYYYNKLPLYLRNSATFPEHFRIWCELLNGLDKTADKLAGLVNIFDADYLKNYGDICDDFLDMIGKIYGVARNFSADLVVGSAHGMLNFNLTTQEFLILIKAQIIKNFFQGTNEEIEKFYSDAQLPIVMKTSGIATCNCYLFLNLVEGITTTSTNIINMFRCGLLTIQSAGILYIYSTYDSGTVMVWGYKNWEGGQWTI